MLVDALMALDMAVSDDRRLRYFDFVKYIKSSTDTARFSSVSRIIDGVHAMSSVSSPGVRSPGDLYFG